MRKYWQIYKLRLQTTFMYRGGVIILRLSNLILLITLIAVWFAAKTEGSIGGYSKDGLITYYFFGALLNSIVFWHSTPRIREEIANGEISAKALLKPISYYWQKFFEEFGWHTVSPLFNLMVMLVVAIFIGTHIQLSLPFQMLPILILSIALASVLFFNLSTCLGLTSFWFTETAGVTSFVWMGVFLLGGQAIPISFFPEAVSWLIELLPFRYVFSFPLEIYLGKLNASELVFGFSIQIIWLLALSFAYGIFWRKGIKHYSAFGG